MKTSCAPAGFKLPGSIGSLNCMAKAALVPTYWLLATLVFTTYGTVTSGPAMVVKSVAKLMLDGASVMEPPLNWIELPVTDTGLMALLKFKLTPAFVPILVDEFG